MQTVKPKWLGKGLVLVCERCSRERIPDEDPEVAARFPPVPLRDWLKRRLKEDGHWGPIRALTTSCLDVCARRRVTVCTLPHCGSPQVGVVDPLADREEIYQTILDAFR